MIKKLLNVLNGWYIRFCGRPGALKRAVKKANKLHKKTGQRYRVFFFGNKYYAWNRQDIKERKRSGLFYKYLKVGADFDAICFYDTNYPEGYVPKY